MSLSPCALTKTIDPLLMQQEIFVMLRENNDLLCSRLTLGSAYQARNNHWAHEKIISSVKSVSWPIGMESNETGKISQIENQHGLLMLIAASKETTRSLRQNNLSHQQKRPESYPGDHSGDLADRAAHISSGIDINCHLGACTIAIGVILETFQTTNRPYIGPATSKRAAIRSTHIAGRSVGRGCSNLGDNERGAFFCDTHFLANHGASCSSSASFKVSRNGHSSQDTHDGHHDHELNQGETLGCPLSLTQG